MIQKPLLHASMLGLCLLLASCHGLADYVDKRKADLSDCAKIRLALGQVGLYAEMQATSLAEPAVGFMDVSLGRSYVVHWHPHREGDPGQVRTAAFPTLLLGWPFYGRHESDSGYDDTLPYLRGALAPLILMGNDHVEERSGSILGLHRLIPNPRLGEPEQSTRISDHFWFGGSLTALFASAGLGLNLAEVLDWLTGFFGWDLLKDDSSDEQGV